MDERLVMFTRARVAEMAEMRENRLGYWERTGLVTPTVEERLTGNRAVRLYDFTDMMSILVIAALREQVSLQHIRLIVAYLQRLDFKVSEVTFAIAGRKVHFQASDGKWEDISEQGQIVLHQVLDLKPLRARIRRAAARRGGAAGQIEKRRGARGSKPLLAGTRVPVSAVQAYLDNGVDTAEILRAYPDLSSADIDRVRQTASA